MHKTVLAGTAVPIEISESKSDLSYCTNSETKQDASQHACQALKLEVSLYNVQHTCYMLVTNKLKHVYGDLAL